MNITPEMARAELARRELSKRQERQEQQPFEYQPETFGQKLPRNIGIGFAQLGHRILNEPYEIAKGLESSSRNIGDLINEKLGLNKLGIEDIKTKGKPISEYIPHQQEYDFAEMLGQKGEGTLADKLIQRGIEYAPEIMSGKAILKEGLRKFPITQRMAAKPLKQAEKLWKEKNVGKMPVNKDLIAKSKEYLPQTRPVKRMIRKAEEGDYKSVFDLQSQIGQIARKKRKSPIVAEYVEAPILDQMKQDILRHLRTHAARTGNKEISKLIREGVSGYRRYKKIQEKGKPILKTLAIPTTIGALGYEGYKKGKSFLSD